MSKSLICVSTFQKQEALQVILESLIEHGYHNNNDIIVTDDNGGEGYTITKEGNPNHPFFVENLESTSSVRLSAPQVVAEINEKHGTNILCIHGKGRGGVAINKNRAIKYFLDNKDKYEDILMLDDDIVILSPNIIERCRETRHNHLGAYLGGPDEIEGPELVWGDTNSFWAVPQFKPVGEDDHVYFSRGAQGMLIYVRKDLLTQVGYFNVLKHKYGLEHSLFSNRLNLEDGKHPDWFPILKGSGKLLTSQSIPNNYTIDNVFANHDEWIKTKELCFRGIGIKITYPGDLEQNGNPQGPKRTKVRKTTRSKRRGKGQK